MIKKGNRTSLLAREDHKKSQGYVDLKKLNENELQELIQRQEKLLCNKSFILKLPDKGLKIISFKKEIENEIKKRNEELDSACALLSNLNIRPVPEDIEWNEGKNLEPKNGFDSDDDSDEDIDPLKLIASHSGTVHCRRKRVVKSEPSLITANDLKEAKEIFYEKQLCEKYGKVIQIKERFKPNQLKDNDKEKFAISAKNVKQRLGEKWEVTEATPPVPIYKDTKMISLMESLQLQKEQAQKLREIERQHAAERLLRSMNIKMADSLPTKNITEYRSVKDVFEESDNEGGSEPDDEEKGGVVFYNLIDDVPEST